MGWRGAVRSLNAELRRQERAARSRAREAERAWREAERQSALEAAWAEVDAYEAHLEVLTSVHREAADPIDWPALRDRQEPAPVPEPPPLDQSRSRAAQVALEQHQPGFFEKLFGLKGPRLRLEQAFAEEIEAEARVQAAAAQDYAERKAAHAAACAEVAETRELAQLVLSGDTRAYADVIRGLGCLNELASVVGKQEIRANLGAEQAEMSTSRWSCSASTARGPRSSCRPRRAP